MNIRDELIGKVRVLIETVWAGAQIKLPNVEAWLANFSGEVEDEQQEQLYALYVLSHFMYFDIARFREMLKVVYRDLYRYPIVQRVRKAKGGSLTPSHVADIAADVAVEEKRTRFIGMGNPSESGSLLLYLFRQANELPVTRFLHGHEIFSRFGGVNEIRLRNPSVRHYVFIDDLCGTGTQACEYSRDLVTILKDKDPSVRVSYFVLFATDSGLAQVRTSSKFDCVECVFELDSSFRTFSSNSRVFAASPPEIAKDSAQQVFRHYGSKLIPQHPLGFEDGQLLLGFWHNVPDNTLPTVWYRGPLTWNPIFERHPKFG